MISILNSIFTIVSYVTRWTKLDTACIYFKEFVNQLNLLYICVCLYLQNDTSYEMHKLGRWSNFFVGLSLAQWAVSEFLYFYVLNFSVVFFMHIWSTFI
jgi:hypothetical protein